MRMTICFKATCLTGLLALAGCASSLPEPEKYSGFLKDYSGLQEATSDSGKAVMRWVDPDFKGSHYDSIVYHPVIYYPEPKPTTQIGTDALAALLNYTNIHVKEAVQSHKRLVTQPGAHSLIFRSAISAVDSSKEGLQFYEVVPIALVIAGTQIITGHRTMNTHLYYEAELIDATTGKPMIRVVRKGTGEDLSNETKLITVATMKQAVDDLAADTTAYHTNQKS